MSEQVIKPGKFVSLTYSIADTDDNLLEQNLHVLYHVDLTNMEILNYMPSLNQLYHLLNLEYYESEELTLYFLYQFF